ncbi:MAG TPA: hypothetical protein VM911_23415 [Pyrinomonadaceae bacterium]|jgi:hypothetical protein|nr:hypothetical protein [Pyrinomonadaceae bacterium]
MNCQDFEKIINDLAREQMMEARERATGLAHAEECQRCAARLRDERALSGGLRSLSLSAEHLEAPARVEATLLAAFRNPDRAAAVTPTTIQPTTPVAPIIPVAPAATTRALHRWRWATAIAAALLMLFIAFAATRLQTQQGLQPPAQLASAHDPQPLSVLWDSFAQGRQAARLTSASTTRGRGEVASQFPSPRTQGRERRGVESVAGNRSGVTGGTQPFLNTLASASTGDDDIATDFIPLSYGSDLGGTDGGHVVRVELPRTAMAQFGLPVNAERSAEPVKADVLLGEDGLARAIRFVR